MIPSSLSSKLQGAGPARIPGGGICPGPPASPLHLSPKAEAETKHRQLSSRATTPSSTQNFILLAQTAKTQDSVWHTAGDQHRSVEGGQSITAADQAPASLAAVKDRPPSRPRVQLRAAVLTLDVITDDHHRSPPASCEPRGSEQENGKTCSRGACSSCAPKCTNRTGSLLSFNRHNLDPLNLQKHNSMLIPALLAEMIFPLQGP